MATVLGCGLFHERWWFCCVACGLVGWDVLWCGGVFVVLGLVVFVI